MWLVAKFFDLTPTLHYANVSLAKDSAQLIDFTYVLVSFAGPLTSILLGTVGFICLWFINKNAKISMPIPREPLIKSIMFLRELKCAVVRRKVKLMALVLNELCNAANGHFRTRPSGLADFSVLFVAAFRKV